jgi:hypothetical protein
MRVLMRKRTAVNARKAYSRTSQNVFWIDLPILQLLVFPLVNFSGLKFPRSEFDLSTRTWAFDLGRCNLISSANFVMLSHNSHGSAAFPPIPPPRIISEKICPTSVVRQSHSRSSVGRRIARTPWTSSCLYAASFSICCCASVTPLFGTGDKAANGQSEWYVSRGSRSSGGG